MTTPAAANQSNELLALRITGVVLLIMLLISIWARSYGEHVSLPRYCGDPRSALKHLEQVIINPRPAGDESRRPFIIAAKILFLIPRESQETKSDYLSRVRRHIEDTCR